ncbi:MAG: VOC family protein [Betaproteobacteria bacterium]|nr:VOC family protein [Betaproteobacteria bacterium]
MPTTQSIRFGHFGINCFDIARMEDFYTRVMGMVVADRGYVPPPADRHLVFMTLDPGEHHQFILCSGRTEGQIEKGPFRGGGRGSAINQISFHMASLAELRRARDRLAAAGCNDGTPICHGNAWSIYIRDIEGNPMELYVDSPWYTPQPCGEPFDLDLGDDELYRQTEALCRGRPGFELADSWRARLAAKIEASLAQTAVG